MGRVTATVLFTDLVGSTELRGRLGEEAADELRRKHDQLLAQAVEANNGRVIKGLGDGIMATFAGASDAVAAAVAIQQAVDRLNRSGKAPVPLSVRVGLSAGDVSFEGDDVHGTPVIEASRLCAAAEGGEILAGEMVRWLARADGAERFTPMGSLELKGLADPVPAVRVEWEPAVASSIPMPALLTDVGRIFVGRDAELERLGQLWKEAAAGQRRVALLAGEPGVGKTRLAAELAMRVHEEGGVVLAGRCDEDLGAPYQPFVESLRHFVDHTPSSELEERLGRYGGELTRLVAEVAERVVGLPPPVHTDPESERYRLFDAVAAWLSAVSAEDALLLVLDDLQWAAKPTALLFRHVVRYAELKRVLILVTYRDSELRHGDALAEVLGDLRRESGIERLSLVGFDASAVSAYLEQAMGRSVGRREVELARAVQQETEGNPFFVREVLRHLAETGAIDRSEDGRTSRLPIGAHGIPESVRDVVGRRLSRLSEAANRTLRIAAVAGTEFDFSVVQAAAGSDEETLLASIEEATRARLVMEKPSALGRYRFTHALVRDTLYGGLASSRRVSLHRHVGEAIETVYGGVIEEYLPALAHHWARATTPGADGSKAVDYATRAGDQAMAQLAFEDAASYYEQALAIESGTGERHSRRGQLLVALGKARARSGDPRAADAYRSAVALARSTGDGELLARAALGVADLWGFTGAVNEDRMSLLNEARQALGASVSPLTAELLARLATELYFLPGSWARRDLLSSEAVAVARRLGDPRTLALALHARNYAMWAPGGATERLAIGREIVHLTERGGDPELALHGHAWCQTALLELGDVPALDAELDIYDRLAGALGQPRYRWYATARRAMRALLAGNLDDGEQLARRARTLGTEAGENDAENVFGGQMFVVWQERPSDEAITHNEARCLTAAVTTGPDSFASFSLRLMSLVLLLDTQKTSPAAEAELAGMLETGIERLDPTSYGMGWSVVAVLLASAAVRLCAVDVARRLYDLLLPLDGLNAQDCGAVAFHGAYAHHLGTLAATLACWKEAEEHFADAAAMHEQMAARAFLARTRLDWGRVLRTRRRPGDTERARELLGQALTTARELGLPKVERDAVALLQDGP